MLRLELIFLHLANGGGCFSWRDEDPSVTRALRGYVPQMGDSG
jgi:hypothetical protein